MNSLVIKEESFKKSIKIMMADSSVESMAALARELDMKETTFRSALTNNSIRLVDFIRLSELMGYEVQIKKILD